MSVLLSKIASPLNLDLTIKVPQEFVPGKKLNHYIQDHIPAATEDITWVVSKNGLIVKDQYCYVTVEDGDKIAICPQQGYTVAGIVAAYVSGVTVTSAAGFAALAMTFAGTAIVYGVTYLATLFVIGYGMSMLAGAVLGGSDGGSSSSSSSSEDYDVDQTYGWGTLSQTSSEGVYIPYYYGTNKVSGQTINQFIRIEDEEEETLYMLNALCDHAVDSITDIRINDNPYTYYSDCEVYTRLGTTTDTLITGFDELVTQNDIGAELVDYTEVIRQTQGQCEKIYLMLSAPSGFYYSNNSGGLNSRSITYTIKYRVTGETSWTTFVTDQAWSGRTTSALKKIVEIDGLSLNNYDISITRTNEAETSFRGRSTVYLASIQEVVNEALVYPGIAKYAIKVVATDQLSGGAPSTTCIVSRGYVSVYNTSTSLWEDVSATNPAWICYDLLIQHEIPYARILYDEFLEWANYCDEDIGGGEKRIEINVVIQGGNVWEQVQSIAQMGRAAIIRRNTKYGVFIDKEDTNIYHLFTMGNIVEGTMSLQYLPKKDRASAVEIEYTDPDRDYTRQIVTVYSDDYITDTSTQQQKATVAFNASFSQAQAVREGVYRINSNKYLVRVVTFDAFIDSFACVVGDIFEFQHESVNYLASDIGGVLKDAGNDDGSGNPYITLDKPVYIESGYIYKVKVRLSDDTLVEKTIDTSSISDFSEPFETLNLTQVWADVPTSDDIYAFGRANTYLKSYRITSVTKKDELTRTIIGLEYIPEIYTENDGFVIEEQTWESGNQEAVQVLADEFLSYSSDGGYLSNINVSWHRSYVIASSNWAVWLEDVTAGTNPAKIGTSTTTQYTISNDLVVGHEYKIYISLDTQGLIDTGDNTTTITLLGKEAPPDDVLNFIATWDSIHRAVNFSWDANSDIDIWKYEIRQGSWTSGTTVKQTTANTASIFIDEGTSESITYYIKALDLTGNYSENAAYYTVDVDTSDCNLVTPGDLILSSTSVITSDGGNIAQLLATWNTAAELSDEFACYDVLLEDISTGKSSMSSTTNNEYQWELIPNREYGVSVRAVDVTLNKTNYCTQVTHTTVKDTTAPTTPTSLTATGTFTSIILNWGHSNEADLSFFNVYRNTVDDSGTASLVGSGVADFNNSFGAYTDSPTTTDTYYYWVTAVDTSGNESSYSNSAYAAAEGVAIGPGDITETEIADDSISTPKLQANSVVASKILAGEIGTDHLAADSVTATKIDVTNLAAINADLGTITAGRVQNSGNTTYLDLDNDLMALGSGLTWNGATLAVNGTITITSGSSGYSNLSDIPASLNDINTTEYSYLSDPAGVINSGSTTIDGGKITTNSIAADSIVSNSITSGQLSASCITSNEVGTNQIITSSANIGSAVITEAKIADLSVSTLKMQDQAVTIPVSAYTSGSITLSVGSWTTIQTVTITSTGAPILITASAKFTAVGAEKGIIYIQLLRGSTTIMTVSYASIVGQDSVKTLAYQETPGSGSKTYTIQAYTYDTQNGDYSTTITAANRILTLLEVKK